MQDRSILNRYTNAAGKELEKVISTYFSVLSIPREELCCIVNKALDALIDASNKRAKSGRAKNRRFSLYATLDTERGVVNVSEKRAIFHNVKIECVPVEYEVETTFGDRYIMRSYPPYNVSLIK